MGPDDTIQDLLGVSEGRRRIRAEEQLGWRKNQGFRFVSSSERLVHYADLGTVHSDTFEDLHELVVGRSGI